VVQVTFDPSLVTYRDLLEVFFVIHDPTTRDRQGNDVGEQYRSVIFYHSDDQKRIAEEVIAELNESGTLPSPVVTEVRPAETFWVAEEYHQQYFKKNPKAGYCQFVVRPKIDKFRAKFEELRSAG
jgi:peptide-methionine (S)-S-oxide reductase